ncbi:MAG: nucleotidyltransferase family protein [Caulobacteraceae bacterium]
MTPAIETHVSEIDALCRRFGVRRLDLFGSATRRDFDPERSDADFLVEFGADEGSTAFIDLKEALEGLLRRRVDLVDRQAVEQSRNYIRRRRILGEARPVYGG